jgi:DNA mismatch endonuclease (patch repair protein)
MPKSRLEFWEPKLERNRERDKETMRQLKRDGWKVLVVWECQVKTAAVADKIRSFLEAE